MSKQVVILDYGLGNVKSIANALVEIGADSILSSERSKVMEADALILPGVGAFRKGMDNLNLFKLVPIIHEFVATGKPFLGICLGMQMLMEESEEFGITKGLGLIKGKVVRIPLNIDKVKLPHVSWNELQRPSIERWRGTPFENTPEFSDVYFVHSFVASPDNTKDILATSNYGGTDFCAAVQYENITGTQFHPEKSGKVGLEILSRFLKVKQKNNE